MNDKNKNLLNENTVRRFMKLAKLEPISNSFIKETFQEEVELEESEENKTENLEENETDNLEEMGGYGAREDDAPEDEAGPEPEAEEPAAESSGMEQFAKDVAQALADAIESASNGQVSMSVAQDDAEEAPAMDEEPPAEGEGDPEMAMDMPEEEEEEEMMQEETTDEDVVEEEFDISDATQEEIVQEVYNRIAKKILKSVIK